MDSHYRKAYAIVGYALVNAQLVNKRAGQREVNIVSVFLNSYNGSKLLNDSGKHIKSHLLLFGGQKKKGCRPVM